MHYYFISILNYYFDIFHKNLKHLQIINYKCLLDICLTPRYYILYKIGKSLKNVNNCYYLPI